MRIANSNVTMASNRSYRQGSNSARGTGGFGSLVEGIRIKSENSMSWGDILNLSSGQKGTAGSGIYGRNGFDLSGISSGISQGIDDLPMLRGSMVNLIMSRMQNAGASFFGGTTESFYYEEESTSFSARGQVQTGDGRTIDFGMDITMSRSFMEYTNIQVPQLQNAFMDPLVINTGSAIANLSDQKFYFDLDADGKEEYIKMPTKGSGFLALDENNDGIINDGRELFGALSGDGFFDLKKYDSDGNGWIDENDDIFDKLKVWYKDEKGNDVLMNLKEADVGAIYLGEQDTEFSLVGDSFNTDGVIRSSGFFLKESGGMGTVQHVDLNTAESSEKEMLGTYENLERLGASAEFFKLNSKSVTLNSWTNENGSIKRTDSTDETGEIKERKTENDLKKKNDSLSDIIKAQEENRRARRKELQKNYDEKMRRHKEEQKDLLEEYIEKRREELFNLYGDEDEGEAEEEKVNEEGASIESENDSIAENEAADLTAA